tara:strand:+ start:1593 stop:2405 length:813 start_codon:yes stop_codon:yes gene_type:complete
LRIDLKLSNILIVGVVRNCEKKVIDEVNKINDAFSNALSIQWLIVESDSQDKTVESLRKLKNKINLRFLALGNLIEKFPKRTERIAFCRNIYIREINSNKTYENIQYIIVADLDGVNCDLSVQSVNKCWESNVDWDACFANQSEPYYDVWALRHNEWSPDDCWKLFRYLHRKGMAIPKAQFIAVYSRMLKIHKEYEPIKVHSAFGGLGIYKKNIIENCYYDGLDENGRECCEHVAFHNQMKKGTKLYIIPGLINCGWNEHNKILKPKKIQ